MDCVDELIIQPNVVALGGACMIAARVDTLLIDYDS